MPLYEYRCPDCNARFEKLTRHEVADSVACPECGGARSRRLISVFASFPSSAAGGDPMPTSGGCGCGGSCSCGGH
jgi:putative FmdB family regulatory protein